MYEPGGLYYMRARYYDADTGRFISEDPSGFNGGINLYAYCNNNPVNFVDPLGLEAVTGVGANTRTDSIGQWNVYVHGTNLAGIMGIEPTGLNWGSFVTLPTAVDPATMKIATALNPAEFRNFISQPRPGAGEWFVLVAAPREAVISVGVTPGGAPEFQIRGEHVILDISRNKNP